MQLVFEPDELVVRRDAMRELAKRAAQIGAAHARPPPRVVLQSREVVREEHRDATPLGDVKSIRVGVVERARFLVGHALRVGRRVEHRRAQPRDERAFDRGAHGHGGCGLCGTLGGEQSICHDAIDHLLERLPDQPRTVAVRTRWRPSRGRAARPQSRSRRGRMRRWSWLRRWR